MPVVSHTIGQWNLIRRIAVPSRFELYEVEPLALGSRTSKAELQPDTEEEKEDRTGYVMKLAVNRDDGSSSESSTFNLNSQLIERESRILNLFDDPQIVPVLDAGRVHQYTFLVTPSIAGRPLSEFNINSNELKLIDRIWIARQIAHIVQRCHEAGWCHLDLHPNNLIVDEMCNVTLIDFGFAHPIGHRFPSPQGPMGTIEYRAPEWNQGKSIVSESLDLYSIGKLIVTLIDPTSADHAKSLSGRLRKPADSDDYDWRLANGSTNALHQLKQHAERMTSSIPEARPQLNELIHSLIRIEIELLRTPWKSVLWGQDNESHSAA